MNFKEKYNYIIKKLPTKQKSLNYLNDKFETLKQYSKEKKERIKETDKNKISYRKSLETAIIPKIVGITASQIPHFINHYIEYMKTDTLQKAAFVQRAGTKIEIQEVKEITQKLGNLEESLLTKPINFLNNMDSQQVSNAWDSFSFGITSPEDFVYGGLAFITTLSGIMYLNRKQYNPVFQNLDDSTQYLNMEKKLKNKKKQLKEIYKRKRNYQLENQQMQTNLEDQENEIKTLDSDNKQLYTILSKLNEENKTKESKEEKTEVLIPEIITPEVEK
ncbi:MAG: hypothetical protein PF569_10140 [Candidatus Woesearchaeota archaeon]|jgi:chromosome segregation ATPase|nr:hypothetical protein [Candidatus Woesearchaeota archaeon]